MILDRKNWFLWLILIMATSGLSVFLLAYYLGVYNKDSWYSKPRNWFLGALCFFYPLFFMLIIFWIQICVEVCIKLSTPGQSVYGTPYSWIICLIVPVVGWTLGLVMLIYVMVWPITMLARGEGEKYIIK